MTDAFTEHKPKCLKCGSASRVDRENRIHCSQCGYTKTLGV